MIETPDIKRTILEYHKPMVADKNHRYMSWEHCYLHFRQHEKFKADANFDLASLHLAFYLASWGMYRGSSPLLQKDYKIHLPVIRGAL